MKTISLPAARRRIRLSHFSRSSAMSVVLILQTLVLFTRADLSPEELKWVQWVQDSILIFEGKIVAAHDSNISGIKKSDSRNPIIVEVHYVVSGNEQALTKFRSLVGKQVTVIVNPSFKAAPKLQPGVSAVFFVNPLLYEEKMAVTAEAVVDTQTAKDWLERLNVVIEAFNKKQLKEALDSTDKVVTGSVDTVRELDSKKLDDLQTLANGRDLNSEHSPEWMGAVIKVDSVLKGDPAEKMVLVVFPSTDDGMWAEAP